MSPPRLAFLVLMTRYYSDFPSASQPLSDAAMRRYSRRTRSGVRTAMASVIAAKQAEVTGIENATARASSTSARTATLKKVNCP